MKKIIALISAAVMALTLVSCGANQKADNKYHIGIIQLLEHEALDAATEGFKQALIDKLGEENVVFDYQNAQGETANCTTICSQFVSDNDDLILANATPALQAAVAATTDIPILGTSITDYASALQITDWNGATGINVSGTSDLAPLDKQYAMIKELCPNVKKVGLVYCSSEANSAYQINEVEKLLKADNLAYEKYAVTDSNDIQSIVSGAVESCDALYIPTDNTLANNIEIVKNITLEKKIPVICGEENMTKKGGLATLSISYKDIGYQAGLMAYEILVNGADVSKMEIQYATETTFKYNPEIAEAIGITVPSTYQAIDMNA